MSVASLLTVRGRFSVTVGQDELLLALQRGEDDAFRRIADTELDGLYLLAYRILGNRTDAEDVCQEVLTKLYQSARTLRSGTVLRAWLRRVCVNCCLNMRRRSRSRAHPDPYAEISDDMPSGDDTDETVADHAFRAAVRDALEQLSPRQRATFVLRHFQECSVKETADILGCAEGTVKVQFSRAVLRLRGLLHDWYDVPEEGGHHAALPPSAGPVG